MGLLWNEVMAMQRDSTSEEHAANQLSHWMRCRRNVVLALGICRIQLKTQIPYLSTTSLSVVPFLRTGTKLD